MTIYQNISVFSRSSIRDRIDLHAYYFKNFGLKIIMKQKNTLPLKLKKLVFHDLVF